MIFSNLDIEELIAFQMEFLSSFEKFAVEFHGDQRDKSSATFDHATIALICQFRRTNVLREISADEDALAFEVIQPQADITFGVE